MKKHVLIILILLFSTVYADSWQEDWINAVEFCEKKDFDVALNYFDLAIEKMEQQGDLVHPYVYVDRGRLHLLFHRNELALEDLDLAINSNNLSKQEKVRAHLSRMFARARLGMSKGFSEDLEKFSENNQNSPTFEKTDTHLIIRNAPDSKCYENIMTCYLIHSGQCLSKKDIKIMKSGIWIIKTHCGCKSCKGILENERRCDHCGKKIIHFDPKEENCREWCDKMSMAGSVWCSNTFKSIRCQIACGEAVSQIKKGCYWCCSGEGFYRNCIKPFEVILDYIKEPCDPYWD